jgi:hypothetical protein
LPAPIVFPKSLDNVHGRFLVALAIRRRAKIPIGQHELELLGGHLFRTALVEQTVEGDLPLAPSPDHAGYLKGLVNQSPIFVPWYLADVFPSAEIAQHMERLARRLQVDPEGSICLSGSGVFRGAISVIGDIDFCEYAVSKPSAIPGFISQMLLRGDDAPLARIYLLGVRPSIDFFAPWPPCLEQLNTHYRADQPTSVPILVFEHIVSNDVLGVLPCTNRVLPVEPKSPAEGHGATTFVFQEAVFSRGDRPPRSLVAPHELGDYVAWLRDQIRPEAEADEKLNSVKQLKRGLSLARLIHLHDLGDEALALLKDPLVERYVRQKTVRELKRLIKYLPLGEQEIWRRSLQESSDAVDRLEKADEREVDSRAGRVVGRVGSEYDNIADQLLRVFI